MNTRHHTRNFSLKQTELCHKFLIAYEFLMAASNLVAHNLDEPLKTQCFVYNYVTVLPTHNYATSKFTIHLNFTPFQSLIT